MPPSGYLFEEVKPLTNTQFAIKAEPAGFQELSPMYSNFEYGDSPALAHGKFQVRAEGTPKKF